MGADGDHVELRVDPWFGLQRTRLSERVPDFDDANRNVGLSASNRMRSSWYVPRAMLIIHTLTRRAVRCSAS